VAMLLITAKYFGLDPESMLLMHEEVQKKIHSTLGTI